VIVSLNKLEKAILNEARTVIGDPKLRYESILAWACGDVEARQGERKFYLPNIGVNIVVKGAK
jgi:hypothetical protein